MPISDGRERLLASRLKLKSPLQRIMQRMATTLGVGEDPVLAAYLKMRAGRMRSVSTAGKYAWITEEDGTKKEVTVKNGRVVEVVIKSCDE